MKMLIDKLVTDWAWRVNDGMPDPSKKDHLELLEQTLRANKYSEEFIQKFMSEIEFSDKKDFLKYKAKHNMRPTTKVTIGGKDTTAGDADPEKKSEGGFDEKLQKKATKMEDKISSASEQVAFSSEEDETNFNSGINKLFSVLLINLIHLSVH